MPLRVASYCYNAKIAYFISQLTGWLKHHSNLKMNFAVDAADAAAVDCPLNYSWQLPEPCIPAAFPHYDRRDAISFAASAAE
jgi:hypothetical protein